MGYYINFTRITTDDQLNLLMAFKNKQTKLLAILTIVIHITKL